LYICDVPLLLETYMYKKSPLCTNFYTDCEQIPKMSMSRILEEDNSEDNDLGKVARICSAHCVGSNKGDSGDDKDGLQLWLDIEYQCVGKYIKETVNKDVDKIPLLNSRGVLEMDSKAQFVVQKTNYSQIFRTSAGLWSSLIAVIGLWIGYFIGRQISRMKSIKSVRGVLYSSLPTSADDGSINHEKSVNFRSPTL
jgi:hypothetical protein